MSGRSRNGSNNARDKRVVVMKESAIRQFAYAREELKNRLLQDLSDRGIDLQGQVRLTFCEWGVLLEELQGIVQEYPPGKEPWNHERDL
jgi:hypothetical protein